MQDIQLAQNQRAQLHAQIWKMANEVRGAVDGWDFKQFVLGMLFYRFISEQFVRTVEGGDSSIGYAQMADEEISALERDTIIRRLGYYIAPSQLFGNVIRTAAQDTDLNTRLKNIFNAIEGSALGYPSEKQLQGLFADFDTTSTRLGNTLSRGWRCTGSGRYAASTIPPVDRARCCCRRAIWSVSAASAGTTVGRRST